MVYRSTISTIMKTANLIIALSLIASATGQQVTAIEFEDGSGCKFNYQLNSHNKWLFIDLTESMKSLL